MNISMRSLTAFIDRERSSNTENSNVFNLIRKVMRWDQPYSLKKKDIKNMKRTFHLQSNKKQLTFKSEVQDIDIKGMYLAVALSNSNFKLLKFSKNRVVSLIPTKNLDLPKVGHANSINCLCLNDDQSLLATGSADNSIKLWNVFNEFVELSQTLESHTSLINSVSFNYDSSLLASASDDSTIKIWRVKDSQASLSQTISDHTNYVKSVSFSPVGGILASGSYDVTVKLWKINDPLKRTSPENTAELIQTLKEHENSVTTVRFNQQGTMLASGSTDNLIRLWNISKDFSANFLLSLYGHSKFIKSLSFNSSGSLLASASWDKTVKLWKVEGSSTQFVQSLSRHDKYVQSVCFNEDDTELMSGSWDKTVKLWKIEDLGLEEVETMSEHDYAVTCLSYSSKSNLLVSGSLDKTLKIWKVTGQNTVLLQTLHGHSKAVEAVSINKEGTMVASGGRDQLVVIWGAQILGVGMEKLQTLSQHSNTVTTLQFNDNGTILATGSTDSRIKIWKICKQKVTPIDNLTEHSLAISCLCFNQKSTLMATSSDDNRVILWKVSSRGVVGISQMLEDDHSHCHPSDYSNTTQNHLSYMKTLVFNPQGTILAAGSQDSTIKLWKVRNGVASLVQRLEGHSGPVTCLTFNHNGSILVSGSLDKTISLWKVDGFSAQHIESIDNYGKPVTSICFNISKTSGVSSSTVLFNGSNDNKIGINVFSIGAFKTSDFNFLNLVSDIFNLNFEQEKLQEYLQYYVPNFQRMNLFTQKCQFFISLNPLLFAQRSHSKSVLQSALDIYGYDNTFYNFAEKGYDPLMAAISDSDDEMLDVWIRYLKRNPSVCPPRTKNFFKFIFQQNSKIFQKFAFSLFFETSYSNKIDIPERMVIDPDISYIITEGPEPFLMKQNILKMQSQGPKNMESSPCVIRSSKIRFSTYLTDPIIIIVLRKVRDSSTLRESRIVRALVDQVFKKTSVYFTIYSSLNFVTVTLFSLHSIWEFTHLAIVIPLFGTSALMMFYELVILLKGPSKFANDGWNLIDLMIYPSMIAYTIYHLFYGFDYQINDFYNSIIYLFMVIVYTRSITMLRALDKARYLVAMISQVCLDIRFFLFLMLIIIILTANTEILSKKVALGVEYEGTFDEWLKTIDDQYNYAFGNWGESNTFQWLHYQVYLFSGVFTGLVLFNILIAIVSKTFEDFTERQGAINLEEQLNMLIDLGAFMTVGRSTSTMRSAGGSYLHIAEMGSDTDLRSVIQTSNKVSLRG